MKKAPDSHRGAFFCHPNAMTTVDTNTTAMVNPAISAMSRSRCMGLIWILESVFITT